MEVAMAQNAVKQRAQQMLFGAPLPFLWLLGCWKGVSKVPVACLVVIDAVPLAAF